MINKSLENQPRYGSEPNVDDLAKCWDAALNQIRVDLKPSIKFPRRRDEHASYGRDIFESRRTQPRPVIPVVPDDNISGSEEKPGNLKPTEPWTSESPEDYYDNPMERRFLPQLQRWAKVLVENHPGVYEKYIVDLFEPVCGPLLKEARRDGLPLTRLSPDDEKLLVSLPGSTHLSSWTASILRRHEPSLEDIVVGSLDGNPEVGLGGQKRSGREEVNILRTTPGSAKALLEEALPKLLHPSSSEDTYH